MSEITPAELLEAAKTRLMEKGWVRGRWGSKEGPNCAGGALIAEGLKCNDYLLGEGSSKYLAERFLVGAIQHRGFGNMFSIPTWNDKIAKDFNDVVALFDEAIILAKEAERGV